MYNLRSRKQLPGVIVYNDTLLSNNKRTKSQLNNTKYKIRKTTDSSKENYLFNPKSFKKGNDYTGIIDSSDSDSEDTNIIDADDEYVNDSSESENTEKEDSQSSEDIELDEDEDEDEDIELDENGRIDDTFDPDKDGYFRVTTEPLIAIITKKLKDKFPDLEKDDLNAAVKKALAKAKADLVEEYCGVVPKDASWKAELNSKEVKKLEPLLKEIRKNIKDNTPTIPKILKSGLSGSEKERALQLYDAFKNTEPYTLTYMDLSMQLNDMIRTAPKKLDPNADEKLKELRTKMEEQTPTLQKIMAANITESDKIRAIQLYEIMQQCSFNTEDWFDTQKRINSILDAQFSSPEAVTKVEEEEVSIKKGMVSFTTDLKRKIFELDADPDVKARLYEMYNEMTSSGVSNSKYSELKDKILWAIKLPYRKTITPTLVDKTPESIRDYCNNIYQRLNSEIYGMKEAKQRVIQCLNDRIYNPNSRSLLALKGKPGVGKTKLAKTIAKAAGLPFDKISLGGAIDATIFKGSDNVWSGATPSLLLQILSRVKYSNAVILLDEIDKLGTTERGIEVQHALLHVLDPTQNKEFQDAFLCEFHHDIGKIWFIPTMNDDSKIDPALRDRLDIIDIPPYNREEMVEIIKLHTLPEALIDKGIEPNCITITNEGAYRLLQRLGSEVEEAGMRPVEKAISDIISKLNLLRSLYNDANSIEIPLTYKLTDFRGFPYIITTDTINALHPPTKTTSLTYFM
jgi:Holliday junction resolvasome RuvABC ATP-dependent DNA helicase subunit